MSLLDSVKKALGFSQKALAPKQSFSVSSKMSWQDYSSLLDSNNYFDQFFGWTYKAIKVVADSVVNYKLELAIGDEDEYEPVPNKKSDLMRDLKHFNEFQTLTEARWLTKAHLRLVGSAYWLIVTSENKNYKYEFYILDPTKMTLKVDKFGLPYFYRYQTPEGQLHDIDPENLIIFKYPNPGDWLKGYSTLQASRLPHNTYELAMRYNMNLFGNMGSPQGFLILDGIGKTEKERFEKQLRQKYGSYKNSGKMGVLNRVAEWLRITDSPRELEFKDAISTMREEILSMHGVPKPLVGMTDSTYTNSVEAQRVFQRYTLLPELVNEIDTLNEQLIPKYYGGTLYNYSELFFLTPDPVEADETAQTTNAVALYNAGMIKLNEGRKRVGEDPDDELGDSYKVVVNPMAIQGQDNSNQDANTNGGSNNQTPNPKDEPKKSYVLERLEKRINELETESTDKKVKIELGEKRNKLRTFFYDKAIKQEKIFVDVSVNWFKDQEERVLQTLTPAKAAGETVVAYDWNKEVKYAEEYFAEVWSQVAREASKTANEIIRDNVAMSNIVQRRLQAQKAKFASDINKTTRDDITAIIEDGIKKKLSPTEIGANISKKYQQYGKYGEDGRVDSGTQSRAERMAQTSVNQISNYVYRSTYAKSENVSGYEWLTSHDSYVRSEPQGGHVAVDGATVSKGAKFRVEGEYLEFPGDENGSAENIINCRCTAIPVLR